MVRPPAIQATFRLEAAANDQGRALDVEHEKRLEATRTLKTSEADLATAREELKARRLADAKEQLAIAKELVANLTKKAAAAEEAKNAAEWAKDEAIRAKAESDFGREEALASKEEAEKAAYAAGVAEMEAAYKAQVPGVCRRYCSQVWGEALKQAGVEASSDLWKVESVYYPPAICEATSGSSEVEEVVEEVGATPSEGASVAGLAGEPVKGGDPPGVVGSREGPDEGAPQEVVNPSSDALSSAKKATILAVPLQAILLSQSSKDPEAATN
ncbi:uncharacterized protein LOC136069338 [Quercus suber]|uniref:uncharacterized protein LOC136069338 n=1 Tax=Quercus suber TaxID=58331 RepID=UPI0032DEF4BF